MDAQSQNLLARQRTELANERTLLAYIRTALGFVIVGVSALWWIDHPYGQGLGALSLAVGLGCLALGIHRFVEVKHLIAREFGSQEGSTQVDRSRAA